MHPLNVAELAGLPSLSVPKHDAPPDAPAGVILGRSESPAVAASHLAPILQISVHGMLGHKKTPCVSTGRFLEMERAKRLELIVSLLQMCLGEETYASLTERPACGHAQGENNGSADDKLAAWAEELHEVIVAWPSIASNVQNGLMALVRSQKTPTLRP